MPSSSHLTELCRYHYDPLDRQAACTLTLVQPATLQRFYCTSRLATEIHGAVRTSLFQHDDQLFAQQRHQNDQVDTTLLATDQQRTVLSALDATRPHPLAYTPYGHRPAENGLLSLLGFNGQRPDPVTGHYHLGNGYRQFNPVLMRFNSPDSWSPFGKGGINAYGYCEGDSINKVDPNGHNWLSAFIKSTSSRVAMAPKTTHPTQRISKSTIKSFTSTVKDLGGEEHFSMLAKRENTSPEGYLIKKWFERHELTTELLHPPMSSTETNIKANIKLLATRNKVARDLLGATKQSDTGDIAFLTTYRVNNQSALKNNNELLQMRSNGGLPPFYTTEQGYSDPLPSYDQAVPQTQSIRRGR